MLVVGCGNPLAGDDSAGVEIVRRLGDLKDCGCDLRSEPASAIDLLDLFSLADILLIVDAMAGGNAPGTLILTPLPSKELERRTISSVSHHVWDLSEAIGLARALGHQIPRLFLLGVEAGTVSQGAPRSAVVEQAISLVVQRFSNLRSLLLSNTSPDEIGIRSFPPGDSSFPGQIWG